MREVLRIFAGVLLVLALIFTAAMLGGCGALYHAAKDGDIR